MMWKQREIPLVEPSSSATARHKVSLALATSVIVLLILGGLWFWDRRVRPQNLVSTGIAMVDESRLDEAIAAFHEAIRLWPDYAEAYCHLGIALDAQSKPAEAIAPLHEAIRLNPGYADAHFALGRALSRLVRADDDVQAKLDEAMRAYREAIRLKPGNGYRLYWLGKTLRRAGQFEEAIAAFQDAFRSGYREEIIYYDLSDAKGSQQKATEALAAYQEAVRVKPADVAVHKNLLGVALETREKLGEAIRAFREAIRLRPEFAEAYKNLGLALGRQGKLVEAIAAFREATRLDPADNTSTRQHLSAALKLLRELSGLAPQQGPALSEPPRNAGSDGSSPSRIPIPSSVKTH
jgi:tetratricopeptide (TPR) repeat protein